MACAWPLLPLPCTFLWHQGLLRQKDADLKQANAELEERGKLLYKTKVHTPAIAGAVCSARASTREAGAGLWSTGGCSAIYHA